MRACRATLLAATLLVSFAVGLPAPFEGSNTLQGDGVVKSVDEAIHSVTVIDTQGGGASVTVTDTVTGNLGQIKPGGKVHIRMMRTAVVSVPRDAAGHAVAAQPAAANTFQNVAAEVQAIKRATGIMRLAELERRGVSHSGA